MVIHKLAFFYFIPIHHVERPSDLCFSFSLAGSGSCCLFIIYQLQSNSYTATAIRAGSPRLPCWALSCAGTGRWADAGPVPSLGLGRCCSHDVLFSQHPPESIIFKTYISI